MRVLCSLVHVSVLGELVDEEPEHDAKTDSLPERASDHVEHLVVDAMHLLETLEVALLRWGVSNGPESEIVHMTERAEVILERDIDSSLLQVQTLVRELGHSHVVVVGDGLTQVCSCRFHVRKFAAHFIY